MKTLAFLYLFLYLAAAKLFLGSLALLCFRVWVRDAAWIAPLVGPATAILRIGRWLAPGFLVLAALKGALYPAAQAGTFRAAYMSTPWFAARGMIHWAAWLWLASAARKERGWVGGPGLVILLLTITFSAIDWELALTPEFGSTAYGLIFFLSAALSGFALAVFRAAGGSSPKQRQDQGSVHLALVCVFTYVSFMQFLITWGGNLPRESHWYLERVRHGWATAPALIALLQFAVPFFLLLQARVKRDFFMTRALAATSISQQFLFTAWGIFPVGALPFAAGLAVVVLVTAVLLLGKEGRRASA